MGRFDDLRRYLAEHEDPRKAQMNRRIPLRPDEIAAIRAAYPGVPEDYLDYLAEIGWGALCECSYAVYARLIDPSDIFGADNAARFGKGILCFGDNFAGDPAGFVPQEGWKVVELWHDAMRVYDTKQWFSEFLHKKVVDE